MWVFGGQTYALAHQRSPGSEGRVIVYLSDLWRVRCRPAPDGSCASRWGGAVKQIAENRRKAIEAAHEDALRKRDEDGIEIDFPHSQWTTILLT